MKRQRYFFTGMTSLLMIFVVILLGVFGILTYMSARSDLLLTQKNQASVQSYYEAEGEKAELLYQLDSLIANSSMQDALEELGFIMDETGSIAVWSYPMDENRQYVLKLQVEDNQWSILSDYTQSTVDWQEDDLQIWDGN